MKSAPHIDGLNTGFQDKVPTENINLEEIYHRLFKTFGPQHWWPAETPTEMIVGAVLTQNTAWGNVEKALSQLRLRDLLDLPALHKISAEVLAPLIRSSGFYNLKARRLKAVVAFIFEAYAGSLDQMFSESGPVLRKRLLAVKGLGPETVDCILLYAGRSPYFVVDAYTRRIFSRHHIIHEKAPYQDIQDHFMRGLPRQAPLFNEYHALIVKTAKVFCKTTPDCEKCPLRFLHFDRPNEESIT